MPKSKSSSRQPSFFKKAIPQMPDGYYTPGPNPNLRRFVEEHATPYDPITDKYRIKPFDQPITTSKADPVMNLHSYHQGKKAPEAIRQYIQHYTKPGDIVLDPFAGSGTTALAALLEGRSAISIDISPAATFIAKNHCTPIDTDELQRSLENVQKSIYREIDWLYETRCDRCDGRATTGYTVYSYVFQCPRCLEKTPLFDCVETNNDKGKNIRACPACYARGIVEEIQTRLPRFEPIPVLVSYLCQEGCKPQRGERLHNDPDPKKRAYFEKYDLGKISEINAKPIPHWYPPHRMMNVESDTESWGDKWRAGTSNFRKVADLFTKRNLWALAAIRKATNNSDPLSFAFTGICLNTSIMIRESNTQYLAGTYYVPQISKEVNVWSSFSRRLNQLIEYWTSEDSALASTNVLISTQSATNLSDIPSNSVDYIFTDPPYGGNVQYGELNFVWEAWMNFNTQWHDQEIIVNETRGKTDTIWASLIAKAMEECYRVLKPGRWLSLCYHDTSEGTWQLLQDLMAEIGFIAQPGDETLFIDKAEKSFNQYTASKVTKRDLVINFRKPRLDELTGQLTLFDPSDFVTFQDAARAVLVESLTNHPGSTADRLYDELVSRLVRKGQFERHDFDELLRSVAEPVSEARMQNLFEKEQPNLFGTHEVIRWYLKAAVDVVDEAESAKETAVANRLETFMQRYLAENPEEAGVHYSDLFEQYLPVKDKPRRRLQEWLPEYFFKTAEGTWRPAKNETERAQLAVLRSSGLLRRVKRFGNALLEGVPPHERDLPESPATLADWVRQCRRAGLYEIGRALYEKSGIHFDGLDEMAQIELEEDYQVCVRRSEVRPESKKKKNQPTLFDEVDE